MANEQQGQVQGNEQGHEQKEFKLFQEGVFEATVVGNGPSKTQAGDRQYVIKLRVDKGPDASRFIQAFYRFASDTSQKQKDFFFEQMKRAGWDGKRESLDKPWPNLKVSIEIETETMKASADGKYPERKNSKVKYINSIDGGGVKQLPADEAKSVADAIFGAYGAPAAASSSGQERPDFGRPADPKDSIIPF